MAATVPKSNNLVISELIQQDDDQYISSGEVSRDECDVPVIIVDNEDPIVTRRELWAYYLYYNGNNGVGILVFTQTLFQSLATSAGFDATLGPSNACGPSTPSSACLLPWGSGTKTVSSVILVANGVSFAVMTALFTTIGSAADYGSFGRWLLLILTVICWASQYATIALTGPSRWGLAMGLFMIGWVSYGAILVFYAAFFPRLARNTPLANALKEKYNRGKLSAEEFEVEESLEKNRISNISTAHSNIGYVATLCLTLSILLPLKDNPKADNYTILLINSYSVLIGIWWFIFQQHRPGPPLPKGESYFTIGWKQIWQAAKQYKKLPYTFIYLIAFFLLADGLNTTGTLVSICQNDQFQFSFLKNTYLGLAQAVTSILSTFGFWWIQKYWKINTKTMFVVTNVATILIPFWGMFGIWTEKIGYHREWEFWVYNIIFGLFQAPYYAYSQTMMAELTPPGFDNMFFGLFGLSNRASSIIGPNVIQAIIDRTQSNWKGFPFLFALCFTASLVIWFGVDVKRGRRDAMVFAVEKRKNIIVQ